MKKLPPLFYVLVCLIATSCMHRDSNISITYSNSDHYYSMKANFSKSKTKSVEEYLDRKIGSSNNMSFANTKMDCTIALGDNTRFYVQKWPGTVKIKLDKDQNSEESYQRIKAICEGIKPIVINP